MSDPSLQRFAVNLETWWSDLDQRARPKRAVEAGFEWVELWYWRRWPIDWLANSLRDHGLRVAQFGAWDFEPSLANRANHDQFEAGIREAVEVASILDCQRMNINGPYHDPSRQTAEEVGALVDALRRVAPMVEAAGITLMIEPMNLRVDHPGYTLPASKDVIDVCTDVGSDFVKINWDLYHLHISEGDLVGHLREGFDHVAYIQIADHPGRHEPGTGEIRYEYLLPAITALGYDDVFGLECFPLDGPELAVERIKSIAT